MGVKAEDIRAGLSEGSPGWIEFADEETLMGTMASPAELEAQAQRKSFEHAKYQAFLNALVNEIRGRQPQPREGSYSMAWAAEQATNFVSEISPDSDDPDDYDMPSAGWATCGWNTSGCPAASAPRSATQLSSPRKKPVTTCPSFWARKGAPSA